MFGLASEKIVKVVVRVVIGCGLFLSNYCQNFTIVHPVLFLLQHWQRLAQRGPDRPGRRLGHAATSFEQPQFGHFLLVVGGYGSRGGWIFHMGTKTWERVSVENNWSVTHALTHNTH